MIAILFVICAFLAVRQTNAQCAPGEEVYRGSTTNRPVPCMFNSCPRTYICRSTGIPFVNFCCRPAVDVNFPSSPIVNANVNAAVNGGVGFCPSGTVPFIQTQGSTQPMQCNSGAVCPAPYICTSSTTGLRVCCTAPSAAVSSYTCPAGTITVTFPGSAVAQYCSANFVGVNTVNPYFSCPQGTFCSQNSAYERDGVCCAATPPSGGLGFPQIPIFPIGSILYGPQMLCPNGRLPLIRPLGTIIASVCIPNAVSTGCPGGFYCYSNFGQSVCCPSMFVRSLSGIGLKTSEAGLSSSLLDAQNATGSTNLEKISFKTSFQPQPKSRTRGLKDLYHDVHVNGSRLAINVRSEHSDGVTEKKTQSDN